MSKFGWVVAGACLASLATALIEPSPAAAAEYRSQVRYSRDRFGRLLGVQITIKSDHSTWQFNLTRSFLDLPVRTQVERLDQRYGLGNDTAMVRQVLENLQQSRQQEDLQNQQQNLQRMLNQQQQLQQQLNQQQQLQQQLNQINRPPIMPPPPPPVFQPPVGPR